MQMNNPDICALFRCEPQELAQLKAAFKEQMQTNLVQGKPFLGQAPAVVDANGFIRERMWGSLLTKKSIFRELLMGSRWNGKKPLDWEHKLQAAKKKICGDFTREAQRKHNSKSDGNELIVAERGKRNRAVPSDFWLTSSEEDSNDEEDVPIKQWTMRSRSKRKKLNEKAMWAEALRESGESERIKRPTKPATVHSKDGKKQRGIMGAAGPVIGRPSHTGRRHLPKQPDVFSGAPQAQVLKNSHEGDMTMPDDVLQSIEDLEGQQAAPMREKFRNPGTVEEVPARLYNNTNELSVNAFSQHDVLSQATSPSPHFTKENAKAGMQPITGDEDRIDANESSTHMAHVQRSEKSAERQRSEPHGTNEAEHCDSDDSSVFILPCAPSAAKAYGSLSQSGATPKEQLTAARIQDEAAADASNAGRSSALQSAERDAKPERKGLHASHILERWINMRIEEAVAEAERRIRERVNRQADPIGEGSAGASEGGMTLSREERQRLEQEVAEEIEGKVDRLQRKWRY